MSQTNTPAPEAHDSHDRRGSAVVHPILSGFRQANFLVAVVILLAAAVGLNAAVGALQLHFKKEPVPMAMKFADAMPPVIGNWMRIARNETIDADTLAALGTEEFLFCNYVNAKALGRTPDELRREIDRLKTYEEQEAKALELRRQMPTAVVTLGLTYYTGKADTVAHIPERCYVGNGFEPVGAATEQWELGDRVVPVRSISFEDQTGRGTLPCNVAYFFHCNGEFESDSLAVRAHLQDLRVKYGYYAKVELMCVSKDARGAQGSMKEFLGQALDDINRAIPDWSKYQK